MPAGSTSAATRPMTSERTRIMSPLLLALIERPMHPRVRGRCYGAERSPIGWYG
jgi:hypothetical protein